MNANAASPDIVSAPPAWRSPAAWIRTSDVLAVLLAASVPWSTTLVAIFAVLFVLSLIPGFDAKAFLRSAMRPASIFPIALFGLAVIGTLWASDISWAARLHGINPVAKLLAIPLLIYHFERSSRGIWVVSAFLGSCTILLLLSWWIHATGALWTISHGVPVKNYIAQSQEFALCAFCAMGAAFHLFRAGKSNLAAVLAFLASLFIANLVFVVSSRTVLICIPILSIVFALRFFRWSGVLGFVAVAGVIAVAAWFGSADMRDRAARVWLEYREYETNNSITSTGERLEFWRKSLRFLAAAPVLGHGTGSIKVLFERDSIGQTGVSASIINNPHNQTLNIAVQWGLFGCVILYAMWISHGLCFGGAGLAAWIGLVAVVENVVSSIFNSHIFDFTEGWVYVLAVGVAAGMLQRDKIGGMSAFTQTPDSVPIQDMPR